MSKYIVYARSVVRDGYVSNDVADFYIYDPDTDVIKHWGIAPHIGYFSYNSEYYSTPFGLVSKDDIELRLDEEPPKQ